jgi:CHAT domain-containing protein/tetratricopeptide (TPR) repeat protein
LSAAGLSYAELGKFDDALEVSAQAALMFELLYPTSEYPDGHPAIAGSYANLAAQLAHHGEYGQAQQFVDDALEIYQHLYPASAFPDGHPEIATCLMSQGTLAKDAGDFEKAAERHVLAVAMMKKLYAEIVYPYGHPDLGSALVSAGESLYLQGKTAKGLAWIQGGVDMQLDLAIAVISELSEAEAMNFIQSLRADYYTLLSAWQHAGAPADDLYKTAWRFRAVVSQLMAARREQYGTAAHEVEPLRAQLANVRREMSRLWLAPRDVTSSNGRNRLAELALEKEKLERQSARTAGFTRPIESLARSPSDLSARLNSGSAFVDVVRFMLADEDRAIQQADPKWEYGAFIVAPRTVIKWVRLGPAEPIDATARSWLDTLVHASPTADGGKLRRLVWEPIEEALPPTTSHVFLAPDGILNRIPWHALPGTKRNAVLLEQYSFSLVPHGPFLLAALSAPSRKEGDGLVLAVGDVAYDEPPADGEDANELLAFRAAASDSSARLRWEQLPGTRDEIEDVLALAESRRKVLLSGREATAARVFAQLPKSRWAIFATHGFFADATFRSALQLDQTVFEKRDSVLAGEQVTPLGRNPLLLSGLVLAGANLPKPSDESGMPRGDGGILTAEAIASLPLENLELVVLSACESGLGEVADGEGVFGLQRAFHQAGTTNVVASLWKVDDRATAALMRIFYYKLFRENKPPSVALREAQLAIYHHPEQIGALAASRAPDFGKAAKLVDGGRSSAPATRAATRLWAGFVLSGVGK